MGRLNSTAESTFPPTPKIIFPTPEGSDETFQPQFLIRPETDINIHLIVAMIILSGQSANWSLCIQVKLVSFRIIGRQQLGDFACSHPPTAVLCKWRDCHPGPTKFCGYPSPLGRLWIITGSVSGLLMELHVMFNHRTRIFTKRIRQ